MINLKELAKHAREMKALNDKADPYIDSHETVDLKPEEILALVEDNERMAGALETIESRGNRDTSSSRCICLHDAALALAKHAERFA